MSYKVDRFEARKAMPRSRPVWNDSHLLSNRGESTATQITGRDLSFIYCKLLNHKDDLDEDQSEMWHSGIIAPMQALDQPRPVAQGGARYQPARMW
jgi:hypothetical protein